MKITMALLIVLSLAVAGFAGDKAIRGEIRDSSGRLIYKTFSKGNVTETREPSGKLVTKSRTKNGTTEVRSPSGKLLYKAK